MRFKNHLRSIKATLVDGQTIDDLSKFIPDFVSVTWIDGDIETTDQFLESKSMTRVDMVNKMFLFETLPTALELVRLTFFVEGITVTDATHLIRHRAFSFSAQSAGPTAMTNHDILENDAFELHPGLKHRARELCREANDLCLDAMEAGISYYDARQYMVRAKECKYYVSGNLKDYMMFIATRLGRTNQPTSDNILALLMRKAILNLYPLLESKIPVQKAQEYYLQTINKNLNYNDFPPDKLHQDVLQDRGIDYSQAEFKTPMARDEYPHMGSFEKLVSEILN